MGDEYKYSMTMMMGISRVGPWNSEKVLTKMLSIRTTNNVGINDYMINWKWKQGWNRR